MFQVRLAIDPIKGRIVAKRVKEQTAQVMETIKAILQAAGYSLRDVIQSNVYLASMLLFRDFNDEYANYFDGGFPARTTPGIELMPDALVEISGSL